MMQRIKQGPRPPDLNACLHPEARVVTTSQTARDPGQQDDADDADDAANERRAQFLTQCLRFRQRVSQRMLRHP
jgi:hypothetical protein